MNKALKKVFFLCIAGLAYQNSYAVVRCTPSDDWNTRCANGENCVTVVLHNDDSFGNTWAGIGFSDLGNTWSCGGNENDLTRNVPQTDQKLQFGYRYYSAGTDYKCASTDERIKRNKDGIYYVDLNDYKKEEYPNGIKIVYDTTVYEKCTFKVERN